MKKLFTLLAIALLGVSAWSCSYDDDDLWKAVDDLDSRMEAMEQAMKSANTDIDALRKLVDALQKNVTVTSVVKNNDGYTITFSNGETATITDGKNGIDAPAVSVKKDDDGLYYWTLGGEFILVDGEKIKAQGEDGAPGASAVAPKLRIDTQTKEWEMSVDGGKTWTKMGVKAEGKDGDSMFESVDTASNPGFAVFTLADGGKIEIPFCSGPAERGKNVGMVVERDSVTAPSGPPDMARPREQHMVMLFHKRQRRSAKRQLPQDHSNRSSLSREGRRGARCCLRRWSS